MLMTHQEYDMQLEQLEQLEMLQFKVGISDTSPSLKLVHATPPSKLHQITSNQVYYNCI